MDSQGMQKTDRQPDGCVEEMCLRDKVERRSREGSREGELS